MQRGRGSMVIQATYGILADFRKEVGLPSGSSLYFFLYAHEFVDDYANMSVAFVLKITLLHWHKLSLLRS